MGTRLLTDVEIASLLAERKVLPANWQTRLKLRAKADVRHLQRELSITGEANREFRLLLRQGTLNPLDFSILLTFIDDDQSEYVLLRYNGKHPSEHTNKWEHARRVPGSHKFRNVFHVHSATERYQVEGYQIDGYAEPTTDYSSFETALNLFVTRNGFTVTPIDPSQSEMFEH